MPQDYDALRRPTVLVTTLYVVLALLYWLVLGLTIGHDFGPDK